MTHISSGDLLRAAVASRTELGLAAKQFMDRGELVPDSLVIGMIDHRLQETGGQPSFMLDGFPRTVEQAKALEQSLGGAQVPLDHVVSLDVPRDELVRRLSGRRTCRQCGAMFHVVLDPPHQANICDRCGGALYQREDDREETIHARLDVYDRSTAPLIAFYRSRGLLREIQGTGSTSDVLNRVLARLEAGRAA